LTGGAKLSKRKNRTQDRADWVYGVVDVGTDGSLTVHYDRETDEIEIVGAGSGSTRTERSYERASGKPKVVSSIPSNGKTAFSANRALFAYDWVIAIDTNSRTVGGNRCAVCVSYYVPKRPATYEAPGVPFVPLAAFLIVGISAGVNPERIGWHLTMKHHLDVTRVVNQRVAIVVDSELGLHRAINAREIGYYKNNLLPDAVSMVYASTDTDKDTLQGVMIRMCDSTASALLEHFEKIGFPKLPNNSDDEDYQASATIRTPQSAAAR
jgi:hypothetical protein